MSRIGTHRFLSAPKSKSEHTSIHHQCQISPDVYLLSMASNTAHRPRISTGEGGKTKDGINRYWNSRTFILNDICSRDQPAGLSIAGSQPDKLVVGFPHETQNKMSAADQRHGRRRTSRNCLRNRKIHDTREIISIIPSHGDWKKLHVPRSRRCLATALRLFIADCVREPPDFDALRWLMQFVPADHRYGRSGPPRTT